MNAPAAMKAPLPADWYFDPARLEREKAAIFTDMPTYVGHRDAVPRVGDWRSLEVFDHRRLLVQTTTGPTVLANVCAHRGAELARGNGNGAKLVCPLHRWVYSLDGTLRAAVNFEPTPCKQLKSWPVTEWEGLLFTGDPSLPDRLAPLAEHMSEARHDWALDRIEVSDLAVNWKVMLEVFLDNLHVAPYHPGFSRFVDCKAVASGEGSLAGPGFNFHAVGPGRWTRPATDAFRRYQAGIERVYGGRPQYAATWLFIYPNTMLEWYPATFVASTFWPVSPNETCTVVETHYHPAVYDDPDFRAAEMLTALETGGEDDLLGLRLQRGREAALELGIELDGPTHPQMESALATYWGWLRERCA